MTPKTLLSTGNAGQSASHIQGQDAGTEKQPELSGEAARLLKLGQSAAGSAAAAAKGCPFFGASAEGDVKKLLDMSRETLSSYTPGKPLEIVEVTLKRALELDPIDENGRAHALLGLTYGRMGRWSEASAAYAAALKRDPQNPTLQQLGTQAASNAKSDIAKEPPTHEPIDPSSLLLPPVLQLRLPDVAPLPKESLAEVAGNWLARFTGSALAVPIGLFVGFKLRNGPEAVWDVSVNQGKVSIPNLLATRHDLDTRLHDAYEPSELVDKQQPDQKRPWQYETVPSATGAFRFKSDPRQEAVFTRIGDLGADPVTARKNRAEDPTLPNPYLVSQVFLHPKADGERAQAPFLNKAAIAWIQPFVHDLINHRTESVVEGKPYSFELPEDHPIRKMTREAGAEQTHGFIPRTQADTLPDAGKQTYRNEVAPAWDTSEVYGSDQATQDRLRTGPDGKMLENGKLYLPNGMLPIDPLTGREMSGMTRNWWTGPQLFQTLFARHHNFVCDQLAKAYPNLSSDEIYGKAKLVIGMVKVRIHTAEWTPAVLPEKAVVQGLNTNVYGLPQTLMKPVEDRNMYRGWRSDHPLFGLVGGRADDEGSRYNGEPEQFAVAYQLHEAMPEELKIWRLGDDKPSKTVPVEATREKGARALLEEEGFATLFNSLTHEKMEALVNNNLPDFMTHMSVGDQMAIDVGAHDILRVRERLGYGYNEALRQLGLPQIKRFEDLRADPETTKKMYEIYGPGPEGLAKLDLKVGFRSDQRRPLKGFDMWMFAVFEELASRRIKADPWLTEKFKPRFYTKVGIQLVDRIPLSAFSKEVRDQKGAIQGPKGGDAPVTMRNLMLLHAPEWKDSDNVKNDIRNFFEPHGTTYAEAPQEHPLRDFEKYSA
ncbi:MAG: hypothetical protein IT384_18090 [Deltaproteobacteria bacterium]|nr:hypothetical protein [Deltaproteobacteria bacterium]